jgi:plasmid stabilization system protein ParE
MAGKPALSVTRPLISPTALRDIDSIWQYIARDSEHYADRVQEAIFKAIATAARTPALGHRRPELSERPIRFLAVKRYETYSIAYAEDSDPLRILRVLHGARDVPKAFRSWRG